MAQSIGVTITNTQNTNYYASPSSSSASSLASNIGESIASVAGVIWNFPNSVVGATLGLAGVPFGAQVSCCANNAIQFTNNPLMSSTGAITLGNVINYGTSVGANTILDDSGNTMGTHEEQHTYQGELLGPLYLPSNFLGSTAGLLINGKQRGSANWNEAGPYSNPQTPW